MTITVTPVTLPDLTTAALAGTGVFDVLMRSMKAHLESEFNKNRIKGPEYSTVYLGSLQAVLNSSLQFLLQKDKATLEAELVRAQIALAAQQLLNEQVQLAILQAQLTKIPAEVAQITAQTALTTQQTINAVQERLVLIATECKLKAEFDLLVLSKEKTEQEKLLLLWKVNTEKAQTLSMGVDENSVIGKQKSLYAAQTGGFTRDAEQKVAKIMVDTWNTRRMTDEGTVADGTNQLNDVTVGRAVSKLLAGVNA